MGFIVDGIKAVGNAIGSVVEGVGKVVKGIADTVGGIAGAVGDFIKNNPVGQFLSNIPGLGSIVSCIGGVADVVKDVSGAVGDVAGFASRLGGELAGDGQDASASVSPTGLGFAGAAVQSFGSVDDLAGLSEGLSSMFSPEVPRTGDQQQVSDLGVWNIAQMLAKRQAELT